MLTRILMILAASFAIGGCSTMGDYGPVSSQAVKNQEGHVIGLKQMMRNKDTGETMAQVQLFVPVRNSQGEVIAYEERSGDSSIIRGVDGRRVGTRFNDMRSRSTNARSRGITVIIGGLDTRRVVTDAAPMREIIASLSSEELSAIR